MSIRSGSRQGHLTLALSTVLHAFMHGYTVMLVPLYLLIRQSLHLPGVNAAALIVAIYLMVAMIFSYPAGVLADRLDRKWLLGVGLVGNALMILLMGLTHSYVLLLVLGGMAGLFATLFHPSANALVPEHYPQAPGMALGLLSVGSAFGFFFGAQYSGWRAQSATWQIPGLHIDNWQHPCIELGLAGLIVGIIFLLSAHEARGQQRSGSRPVIRHRPLGRRLRWKMIAISAVLGCRDFAGVGMLTLVSIYLQKAHDMNAKQVGFMLGAMMLIGIVINPVAVWLSGGRRRLWVLAALLISGGVIMGAIPHWSVRWTLLILCAFEAMQLSSYAVSDAATYERVRPIHRGRVAGLYLSLAGTASATSPWILSWWTDRLGDSALQPSAYFIPFAVLGALMAIAALSIPLISRLGPLQGGTAVEPALAVDVLV